MIYIGLSEWHMLLLIQALLRYDLQIEKRKIVFAYLILQS